MSFATRYLGEKDDKELVKMADSWALDADELEELNDELEHRGIWCVCGHSISGHDGYSCLGCQDNDPDDEVPAVHTLEVIYPGVGAEVPTEVGG